MKKLFLLFCVFLFSCCENGHAAISTNTLGPVSVVVSVSNNQIMTCTLTANVTGFIALTWGGSHGSQSPGVVCAIQSGVPTCRDFNIQGRAAFNLSSTQLVTTTTGSLTGGILTFTFTRPISSITANVSSYWSVSNTVPNFATGQLTVKHDTMGGPVNFQFTVDPANTVTNIIGQVNASVSVSNNIMTCTVSTVATGYLTIVWGGGHGSGSPGVVCALQSGVPTCRDFNLLGKGGLALSTNQLVTTISGALANGVLAFTFTRPITGIPSNVSAYWSRSNTIPNISAGQFATIHDSRGGPFSFVYDIASPTPSPTLPLTAITSVLGLVTASVAVENNTMICSLSATAAGFIAIAFGAHGSGAPAIACGVSQSTVICRDFNIQARSATAVSTTQVVQGISGSVNNGVMSVLFSRSLVGIRNNNETSLQVYWAVSNTTFNGSQVAFHNVGKGGPVSLQFVAAPTPAPTEAPVVSTLGLVTVSVSFISTASRENVRITLSAQATGYIAIAFGAHGSSSLAIFCWLDSAGSPKCSDGVINAKASSALSSNNSITDVSGSSTNGILTFSFTRPIVTITTDFTSPINAYWSVSNTQVSVAGNAISAFHDVGKGGPLPLSFIIPVTTAPTPAPPAPGVLSVIGPISCSVLTTNGQMNLNLSYTPTKRQTFGYLALAFNGGHGTPSSNGIACWMDNTSPVCYDITVGGKSTSGVVTGNQITGVTGGSSNGQMFFSLTRSLTFGSLTLNPNVQVLTFWSIGSTAPVDKQLAYHSLRADASAPLFLSENAGTASPTPAPTTSTTSSGLSSTTVAIIIIIIAVVVVVILVGALFMWKRRANNAPLSRLPGNEFNPVFHPDDKKISPRAL